MTDPSSPENTPWGWKALIIFCIIGAIFMLVLWLALSNEPDYMPSQQKKQAQSMTHTQPKSAEPTAQEMNMTAEEHAAMNDQATSEANPHSTSHGH